MERPFEKDTLENLEDEIRLGIGWLAGEILRGTTRSYDAKKCGKDM